jgi:hypothetical protein
MSDDDTNLTLDRNIGDYLKALAAGESQQQEELVAQCPHYLACRLYGHSDQ